MIASFAAPTPTSYTARASIEAVIALTFEVDPSVGAGHRHKRHDRCLSVAIDGEGVRWNCWHCGWRGAAFVNTERSGNRVGQGHARYKPSDFGTARRRERYGILS